MSTLSSGKDNDDADQENLLSRSPKNQKQTNSQLILFAGIISCLMYSTCSIIMVLANKAISLTFEDKSRLPQYSIILFQCLLATILVELAKYFKVVDYPSFDIQTAKSWMPLNLLFIGMLLTGFFALVHVSGILFRTNLNLLSIRKMFLPFIICIIYIYAAAVPMVTIFKNLTNLVTVFGDWYLFGER